MFEKVSAFFEKVSAFFEKVSAFFADLFKKPSEREPKCSTCIHYFKNDTLPVPPAKADNTPKCTLIRDKLDNPSNVDFERGVFGTCGPSAIFFEKNLIGFPN